MKESQEFMTPEKDKRKLRDKKPAREMILGPDEELEEEKEDDSVLSLSLRPTQIDDFVGQKELLENLKISLQAAKKRDEPVDHILFSGPPGLGKTTLAHIVASEMGSRITATSGPAIDRAGDLIGILTNLSDGDILFIDEIHRLPKVVEEFIYPAMENFQIDFIIDKGPYAKTIKFNLKRFTLIGATTRSGLLTSPMRGRFGIFFHLDFYHPEDLKSIVKRSAHLLEISIDDKAASAIAIRSRGTPRIANRLLRRVRDWADIKAEGVITADIVEKSLRSHGIDEMGLDAIDRRVLLNIIDYYSGGPVGIDTLAASLNEEPDTIVDIVEPYLLKIGFLKRTSRGRSVSPLAYDYLKKSKGSGDLFGSKQTDKK